MAEERVDGVVRWGTPPPGRPGGGRPHAPIAEALKAKPGEWGLVGNYGNARMSSQIAYVIRNGRLTAYEPAGSFEAVGRSGEVWARYMGEPDA